MDALKRITDLFVEGKELVLRDEPDAVLVWVNKLNSFDQEEARRDGQVARARFTLALKEDGSPERVLYESEMSKLDTAGLRAALIAETLTDWYLEAGRELRVNPEWAERVTIIERGTTGLAGDELKVVEDLQTQYGEEVQKIAAAKQAEYERDLDRFDQAGLQEEMRKKWLENMGLQAFSRDYQKAQVFYSMRTCVATHKGLNGWDHAECDHGQRACADQDQAGHLPADLIQQVLTALREVSVQRDDARFMAGAASSSASSPQPNEEAASTPSTPAETSSELATTSS